MSKKATKKKPRKVGRPTKYNKKYCEMIIEYFDVDPYEEREIEYAGKDNSFTVFRDVACDFPTLAGFARKIGTWPQRLWEWSEKHPEFQDAVKKAKAIQEDILVTNGMKGLYEKSFAIFGAKNLMNWHDKQHLDHTSNGETIAPVFNFIEKDASDSK